MFKLLKKISTIFLVTFSLSGSLLTILSVTAMATEISTPQISPSDDTNIIPTLALNQSHIQTISLEYGEEAKIIVTKIEEGEPELQLRWSHWHTRNNITNGTYKINVIFGLNNAGFTIRVNNRNITSAYDQWFVSVYQATSSLRLNNSKQATLSLTFTASIPWIGGPSWTGGVRAKIEGSKLVTYYR